MEIADLAIQRRQSPEWKFRMRKHLPDHRQIREREADLEVVPAADLVIVPEAAQRAAPGQEVVLTAVRDPGQRTRLRQEAEAEPPRIQEAGSKQNKTTVTREGQFDYGRNI